MKIIVDDLLVNYQDDGKGKIVLMLHGWGTNLHTFDTLAEHLQNKFRVVRLDFPGFGGSDKPRTAWSVEDYSHFTRQFLEKLDIEDFYTVITHSFGGRIVIKGVATSEIKPEKIILMGSAGVKPTMTIKKAFYKTVAKSGRIVTSLPGLSKLRPALKRRLYKSANATDYLETSSVMRQVFLNVINEDLKQYAADINCPTLLMWGELDDSTPLKDGKILHDLIKDSKLKVIPAAGHFVYEDAPDAVYKEIDEFIA